LPKIDFDRLLIEAVEEGLSSLGESSKQAIYFHLEKSFNIKKEKIPSKIETFAMAFERIFGSGASYLEILIIRRLHEKVGGPVQLHEPKDFTFTEYVNAARRSYVKQKKKQKGSPHIRYSRNIMKK